MIEVKNLSVGYGRERVLENVSLDFRPGELTVLLGPNGSGKSTLIRTVLGLQEKLSGEILIDGQPAETLSPGASARKMSYMAQSRPTPSISARKMVLHGRFPYLSFPRRYRKEDHEAARNAMERTGALPLAEKLLTQLSGGQKQKVYLAMTLAQDTQTIFMDEPTTYLDVEHQLSVMETARTLADEGRAVVLVLHDLCMALRCADRVLLLEKGRLAYDGDVEGLYASALVDKVFNIRLRRIGTDRGWHYYYER